MNLVFVGSGNALMATDFREELALEVPVWVDPRRVSYTHLGFKRSLASALSPSVWKHALRAMKAGFRQKKTMGDPWQQGGVLVVQKGGVVEFSFASAEAGDHPPIDLVMEHARKAAAKGKKAP